MPIAPLIVEAPMKITHAISIRQPFVEQILRGVKLKEYRRVPTRIRGRVYLYASLRPFPSAREWAKVGSEPGDLATGCILGSVEIADCRTRADGSYAYILCNPVRLKRPLIPLNQPQPVFWCPKF